MSSTGSSSAALPTECREVRNAVVWGVIDDAMRAHLATCPGKACVFLRDLANASAFQARGASNVAPRGNRPLDPFRAVFDRFADTGDLLLDRYRVIRFVGGGGEGLVYEAEDTIDPGRVALKVVLLAPGVPSEVNIAREFAHPSVARLYHSERHGEIRVVVMEFADGESLAKRLRKGDFTPPERLEIFRAIAGGVRAMHEKRVLHLDLKPENVLLRSNGSPVVTDFGLAQRIPPGETSVCPLGGTDPYWSPEQKRAYHGSDERVDERADVHALGMILLRDLFPKGPRTIARVARRATADRPEDRFPTVAALVEALDWRVRWKRRTRIAATMLAAPAAVLIAAAVVQPPPQVRREPWHEDLWGPDKLAGAPDVARNLRAEGLPSILPEAPALGCARNAWELIDGVAHYSTMEHGYALHGPSAICVNFEALGQCGARNDDAGLCVFKEGAATRRIPGQVRDAAMVPLATGESLGQLELPGDCSRDQGFIITLDAPRRVFALRAWFHSSAPSTLAVDVETTPDHFVNIWRTLENSQQNPLKAPPLGAGASGPVTMPIQPVLTRRIRFALRCDTRDITDPDRKRPGDTPWLTEIEVFAQESRLQGWRRWLVDDR